MTTDTLISAAKRRSRLSTRFLGTLGMIASPMLFLMGLFYGFGELPSNRVTGLMGLVFVLGWICSAIGIRLTGATGAGAAGKILFCLQFIGLLLAASQQIQDIIFEHPEDNGWIYFIADMAWPLSMLLMLVIGCFILKARVWRGWRRWPALLCGLALPTFIVVSVAYRRELGGFLFGVITTAGFMMLGSVVHTSQRIAVPDR